MQHETETRECEKCHQSFVAKVIKDGDKVVWITKLCPTCSQQAEEQRRIEAAQKRLDYLKEQAVEKCRILRDEWAACLPLRFRGLSFKDFDHKLQPKAFSAISNYVLYPTKEGSDEVVTPKSVVLLSPKVYGVGKTHLVCTLAQKLIDDTIPCRVWSKRDCLAYADAPVYFTTEPTLLSRIRSTFSPRFDDAETEEGAYSKLDDYELLIIDDVGKVRPRDSSFLQSVYYRLIDTRYIEGKPIILTSNLSYADFEAHIGGACADRLAEMCGENIIKMTGKSYRSK